VVFGNFIGNGVCTILSQETVTFHPFMSGRHELDGFGEVCTYKAACLIAQRDLFPAM
jgi:hypothetical protein